MTMDNFKQQFIDKYFDGDVTEYDAMIAANNFAADHEYSVYKNRSVLNWKDIELSAKCAPDLQEDAIRLIGNALGYIPAPHSYIPHLPFIQTLLQNQDRAVISEDESSEEIIFHLKRVRNDDMKSGGWVRFKEHKQPDLDLYNSHHSAYKQAAKDRLSKLLGYEPNIAYSLDAELLIRDMIEQDSYHSDMPFVGHDYKAATITVYREIYLTQGEKAADDLDLFCLARRVKLKL